MLSNRSLFISVIMGISILANAALGSAEMSSSDGSSTLLYYSDGPSGSKTTDDSSLIPDIPTVSNISETHMLFNDESHALQSKVCQIVSDIADSCSTTQFLANNVAMGDQSSVIVDKGSRRSRPSMKTMEGLSNKDGTRKGVKKVCNKTGLRSYTNKRYGRCKFILRSCESMSDYSSISTGIKHKDRRGRKCTKRGDQDIAAGGAASCRNSSDSDVNMESTSISDRDNHNNRNNDCDDISDCDNGSNSKSGDDSNCDRDNNMDSDEAVADARNSKDVGVTNNPLDGTHMGQYSECVAVFGFLFGAQPAVSSGKPMEKEQVDRLSSEDAEMAE